MGVRWRGWFVLRRPLRRGRVHSTRESAPTSQPGVAAHKRGGAGAAVHPASRRPGRARPTRSASRSQSTALAPRGADIKGLAAREAQAPRSSKGRRARGAAVPALPRVGPRGVGRRSAVGRRGRRSCASSPASRAWPAAPFRARGASSCRPDRRKQGSTKGDEDEAAPSGTRRREGLRDRPARRFTRARDTPRAWPRAAARPLPSTPGDPERRRGLPVNGRLVGRTRKPICRFAGRAGLPSEAEWEKAAARQPTDASTPWGGEPRFAQAGANWGNFEGEGPCARPRTRGGPRPVGSYPDGREPL